MVMPSHVEAALNALSLHAPRYEEDREFYEGKRQEIISSQRLRELFGSSSSCFQINYARTPVDAMLEKTIIAGITSADTEVKKRLDQIWFDNELGIEAKDLHRRAYEYGDAYLIAWPDEELPGGVSAFAHDPDSVRVFYEPTNPRRKSHAIQVWRQAREGRDGMWLRIDMLYRDRIEQWVSASALQAGVIPGDEELNYKNIDLMPWLDDGADDGVIENPYDTVPVFHFRTARPYGRSEIEDAKGPQDMLNKINPTMMASIDYAGYPQRYVTTDAALDPQPEDAYSTPPPDSSLSTDAGLPGLDDDSLMKAGPGENWIIAGSNVKVGQFSVAETANYLNAIHSIIKQMAAVTDVPLHYFDRSGQMPSGESFRQANGPLNNKVEDREAQFGVTWHEFFEFCLAVGGAQGGSDAQVAWAPPEMASDKDAWETAQLKLKTGMDPVQVFTELGYSQDLAELWAVRYENMVTVAQPAPEPGA